MSLSIGGVLLYIIGPGHWTLDLESCSLMPMYATIVDEGAATDRVMGVSDVKAHVTGCRT